MKTLNILNGGLMKRRTFKIIGDEFLEKYPEYKLPVVAHSKEEVLEDIRSHHCVGNFSIEECSLQEVAKMIDF